MSTEGEDTGRDEAIRIAQNEVTFRRVNEALEPAEGEGAAEARYVCECGTLGCTATIPLRRSEYEAVRTSFDRFLVLPGHQDEIDTVVEDHERYLVVEKEGVGARIADDEDPRSEPEPA